MSYHQTINEHVEKFADFIDIERERYAGDDNNRFAIACGGIFKRYETVWTLYERAIPHTHRFANLLDESHKASKRGEANRISEISHEMRPLHDELILLFESFFIFGTILCDEIVQLMGFLYGPAHGIKFGTHRELSKNFSAYVAARGIKFEPALIELAAYLEKELCEIRDKQIVHDFHPRKIDYVSCSFPTPHLQYCCGGFIYPKDTDVPVISKPWDELIEQLRRYVELQLYLIRINKNSRFTLKPQ